MTTLSPTSHGLIGIRGGTFTASVSPWGDVTPHDGSPVLAWHIADEDRWHSPEKEASVRQVRIDGVPVVETRLRVRGGDAIQRVYAAAAHGGVIVIEIENDSPSPIAVALTRNDVITSRVPTQHPIMGIELPATSIVLPIGHRSSVRVALATGDAQNIQLNSLPSADQLVSGWLQSLESASRVRAVDGPLQELALALVDARCALLLGEVCDPLDDALGTVLDGIELVRLGDKAELWLDELVPLAEECLQNHAQHDLSELAQMVAGVQLLLHCCGEERAVRDVAASWQRITDSRKASNATQDAFLSVGMSHGRRVAAVEQQLCTVNGRGETVLLPHGIPELWRGFNWESFGFMAGGGVSASYALRWHGENVAALWEFTGGVPALARCGVDATWSTTKVSSGEALWQVQNT
jgi:hypothetical protein